MGTNELLFKIEKIKTELNPIKVYVKSLLDELNILYDSMNVEGSELPDEVFRIVTIVCNQYGINHKLIQEKTREKKIKDCRQVCQYFIKEFYGYKYSYLTIANFTGLHNHATVYNSISVVENHIECEKKFNDMIIYLREKITNNNMKELLK